jgi:hypothetical protein
MAIFRQTMGMVSGLLTVTRRFALQVTSQCALSHCSLLLGLTKVDSDSPGSLVAFDDPAVVGKPHCHPPAGKIRRNKMRKHATLLGAVLLGFVSVLSYAQAPVPFINLPLLPDATAPGGAQFTLTVNGTGFVSTSVVNWNGTALATQFVNSDQVTAIGPASDSATAGTAWVTVVNPAPGGGTSNLTFFSVTRNEGKSVGFGLASSLSLGAGPMSVAVGDFNGDGKLDLAVANLASNTVSVLLGDGTGNFTLASSPATGVNPISVAVGDFNGDGKLDLAVANNASNTVSILLGDGTGNFTLVSSPAVGESPMSVAVGDFNGDGKLDLAVANCGWDSDYCTFRGLSILLGDGTGNFTLASSPAVGTNPLIVAVGDFNGDGKLDLAVARCGNNDYCPDNAGILSILLGDGTGNFTLASSLTLESYPTSVAVGDFNGDGKLDLAVALGLFDAVSILLGDGTGNFTLASNAHVCIPQSVAVGDFNGDGILDLAVATECESASIMLGDGAGNFKWVSSAATGYDSSAVGVGDFNGDGKLDLAVVNEGPDDISILLQHIPAVTLSPANLSFGTQLVGTSSSPQPVTLTNTGSVHLKIANIAASANFSQTNNCPSSVSPNGQCTINVTFKPRGRDKHTGTVTITDNAPNSPQTVPLTGVGTAVSLVPSGLDFGNQKVGTTSQPQVVTLTNHGTAAVNISSIHFTGTNGGAFAQTNNCGTSVPAGGNCTISVTFAPKATGPKAATLEVKDNGGASPQTVGLSGTGTK